jgi:small GTP-binding protein
MASLALSEIDTTENKVILLGDSGTGKTSLVTRLINHQFQENMKPTIGCDFSQKEFDVAGKKVRVSIWDTAGQERFRAISYCYYKLMKIALLVFDLTNRKSFERLNFWMHEIQCQAQGSPFVVVIGNKADLVTDRAVRREEAETWVAKNKCKIYFETSAKSENDKNIDKAFEFIAQHISDITWGEAETLGGRQLDLLSNMGDRIPGENEPSKCSC